MLLLVAVGMTGCKENKWLEWKAINEAWMGTHLATDTGVQVSPTGLRYRIIADPNPSEARPNDNSYVACSYQLHLIDGTLIEEASHAQFYLQTKTAGFREGLRKIHVHGDIELWIPADLGYGSDSYGTEGYQTFIPPYSTLIYKIHLESAYFN